MKRLSFVSIALCAILAAPVAAYPALGAGAPAPGHRTVRHHKAADFAKASALAAPAAVAAPASRETDGLSRNDDDCNMGCIDH